MLKKLRHFPFHTFLLPAFFVLHIVNQYYDLIPVQYMLTYLFYYLMLSVILLLIGRLFFKSFTKAGTWTTGLLLIFYFFGTTHDFLIKFLPRFITSYTVLLPMILIVCIAFFIYLKKSRRPFITTGNYFTALTGLLVTIEIVLLLFNSISGKEKENNFGLLNKEHIEITNTVNNNQKPDIFFVVFDEYASSLSLQKYFQFSNASTDSLLSQHGFYVAYRSQGNYNSTPLSIGSTLNLQYFNKPFEQDSTTVKSMLQAWHSLKMSALPVLLKKEGYTVLNFGLCDFQNYPVRTSQYFSDYEARLLFEETLYGRIKRDIWWNLPKLGIGFINKSIRTEAASARDHYIDRNAQNFNLALSELRTQGDTPKFVFVHIMMPHAPFYLDRHGFRQPIGLLSERLMTDRNLYVQQLQFTNTLIKYLIGGANHSFSRPRVVIIEGDHGFRDPEFKMPRESHFMNLNAIYFSDKDYSLLYDSISPVNTFRVVLNKYFNANTRLLKDSTIFLR